MTKCGSRKRCYTPQRTEELRLAGKLRDAARKYADALAEEKARCIAATLYDVCSGEYSKTYNEQYCLLYKKNYAGFMERVKKNSEDYARRLADAAAARAAEEFSSPLNSTRRQICHEIRASVFNRACAHYIEQAAAKGDPDIDPEKEAPR